MRSRSGSEGRSPHPHGRWEQHAADTLEEGYWLSDPESVEALNAAIEAEVEQHVDGEREERHRRHRLLRA